MLKVVFFARLKEQLGTAELQLALSTPKTVAEIKQQLIAEHNEWQAPLSANNLLAAINHQMVNQNAEVKPGDELAFFPPVTGG